GPDKFFRLNGTRAENEDGPFTANRYFPDAQWFYFGHEYLHKAGAQGIPVEGGTRCPQRVGMGRSHRIGDNPIHLSFSDHMWTISLFFSSFKESLPGFLISGLILFSLYQKWRTARRAREKIAMPPHAFATDRAATNRREN